MGGPAEHGAARPLGIAIPIVALVGPTAVGKSGLAVDLASEIGGEVVNTDAFQVYRGMDIGTAKATALQRAHVTHHLLDVIEVDQRLTVAQFQTLAREVIAQCRARGVVPVLVGGSALYTRAILDDFEFVGTDPDLRARWQARLEEVGTDALHTELARLDPEAAAAILPSNARRIVRALEVNELTGQPFRAGLPEHRYLDPATVQIGLRCPRPVLRERITTRVHLMWEAGLVEEVRRLETGLRSGPTARKALGYAQVLNHLSGECTEQEARTATMVGTSRFARKQDTWYRRDPRINWLDHDSPDVVSAARSLAQTVPRR